MGGLVFTSINDLPPGMRQQVAVKILANAKGKQVAEQKEAKYHNVKVEADGLTFDSQKEYRRFLVLMEAQKRGAICDLKLQQNFTLIEGFTKPDGERVRPVVYKADFTYRIANFDHPPAYMLPLEDQMYWRNIGKGQLVIEDVKTNGTRTRVYINKMKMMADEGYTIREV
jgi:hypothetical protein